MESNDAVAPGRTRRTKAQPAEPKERDPLDRFYTEDKLARIIAETARGMAPQARTFLEPSSGGGAFLRAMRLAWGLVPSWVFRLPAGCTMPSDPDAWAIHAVDLDPGAREPAESLSAQFFQGPFLEYGTQGDRPGPDGPPDGGYDVILANPPFAAPPAPGRERGEPIACQHVTHALGMLSVGGVMACLIRQSFLASQERAELFGRYCPARVDILVERPSFTQDGKTDQHEYCVIYWQRESRLLFRKPESTVLRWLSWK